MHRLKFDGAVMAGSPLGVDRTKVKFQGGALQHQF